MSNENKFWVYRDQCPIDQQCVHDLRFHDPLSCFNEIQTRAYREWGWPKGAHFVLNVTKDFGSFVVCRGNITHNGKILFEG